LKKRSLLNLGKTVWIIIVFINSKNFVRTNFKQIKIHYYIVKIIIVKLVAIFTLNISNL